MSMEYGVLLRGTLKACNIYTILFEKKKIINSIINKINFFLIIIISFQHFVQIVYLQDCLNNAEQLLIII